MRRVLGSIGLAVLVSLFVPGTAPAAPATATVRCLQVSPNESPGSCTYKSTAFEHEVLSAATLKSWSVDWFENGKHRFFACTTGPCRNEPGFAFNADAGTTIRITITRGVVVVRQVVLGG